MIFQPSRLAVKPPPFGDYPAGHGCCAAVMSRLRPQKTLTLVAMLLRDIALPTIEDVARTAGVSTATVSRVLNKPETVREPLRTRVVLAVTRLGYVPHAGARALKLQRSGTVGAVFPTIDNAIFAKAIDALQRRLACSC